MFSKLTYELATLIFFKRDGSIRVMLGTRNLGTVDLEYGFQGWALGGHDNRCNINNGNVAIFDMIVGEPRSFNIDRLVSIYYHGVITTKEELNSIVEEYEEFKEDYESQIPEEMTMEMLD